MRTIIEFILRNIHTILLMVGLFFIVKSAFMIIDILGYLVLGIACMVVAILVNRSHE